MSFYNKLFNENEELEIANILINAMEDGNDNGNNIHIIRL